MSYEERRQAAAGKAIRFGVMTALGVVILMFAGCQVMSHSVTVNRGEVGVLYKKYGSDAGVQLKELPQGWHWTGIGETIEKFSVRQKVHLFGGKEEQICFADKTGLQMCGDIQGTIQVLPDKAADIYAARNLDLEALIDGPIRNDLRSAVSKEAEKVPVSCSLNPAITSSGATPTPTAGTDQCTGSLMGTGRQKVLADAAETWMNKWRDQGVIITDVQWVGSIRYPAAITNAITARTQTEQRTLAAQAKKAEAEANAAATIATAEGEARALELKGAALRANPQIVEQIYARRSQGLCPPGVKTCIIGQQPTQFMDVTPENE
jgi:regulator of protease activity HflC (stomatin/prohibitin superfamily)